VNIIADPVGVKMITKKNKEQICTNQLDNTDEMDTFLENTEAAKMVSK